MKKLFDIPTLVQFLFENSRFPEGRHGNPGRLPELKKRFVSQLQEFTPYEINEICMWWAERFFTMPEPEELKFLIERQRKMEEFLASIAKRQLTLRAETKLPN